MCTKGNNIKNKEILGPWTINDKFVYYNWNFSNYAKTADKFQARDCNFLSSLRIFVYPVKTSWVAQYFALSISALIVGYISLNKRDSLINGAVLGYFIFVSYIFFGYKGNTELSQYSRFIIFMLLFSFIGALSGLIGSYIGYLIHKKI